MVQSKASKDCRNEMSIDNGNTQLVSFLTSSKHTIKPALRGRFILIGVSVHIDREGMTEFMVVRVRLCAKNSSCSGCSGEEEN